MATGHQSFPYDEKRNSTADYDFQRECDRLDEINKTLTEIESKLVKTRVQSHTLVVDLVTQMNPHVLESLQKANDNCEQCRTVVYGDKAKQEISKDDQVSE